MTSFYSFKVDLVNKATQHVWHFRVIKIWIRWGDNLFHQNRCCCRLWRPFRVKLQKRLCCRELLHCDDEEDDMPQNAIQNSCFYRLAIFAILFVWYDDCNFREKKESYSIIIKVIFAAIFHDNKVIMFHIKKPVHLHISFFEKSFCTKPIVSIQNTILRRKKCPLSKNIHPHSKRNWIQF